MTQDRSKEQCINNRHEDGSFQGGSALRLVKIPSVSHMVPVSEWSLGHCLCWALLLLSPGSLKSLTPNVTEELRRRWRPSHPILFSVLLPSLSTSELQLPLPFPAGLELAGSTSQRHRCKLMVVMRKVTTQESWPLHLHSSVSSTTR